MSCQSNDRDSGQSIDQEQWKTVIITGDDTCDVNAFNVMVSRCIQFVLSCVVLLRHPYTIY